MQFIRRLPGQFISTLFLLSVLILITAGISYAQATFSVSATVETQVTEGDVDDPAIWIHPSNPALSLVIGTIKGTGLAVYNMDGSIVQIADQSGGMNNVDLRYNFPLGGELVDLVVATNRFDPINTLAMYKVNAATRMLENVTADPPISTTLDEVYGTCMYVSPSSGKYYAFITSKEGVIEQWELIDNGAGKVDGLLQRVFDVGTAVEGCVADDIFSDFYAAEEDIAIWKYGAEPGDGTGRTAVDTTAAGHLTSNIEGLAIYYTSSNSGYLLASSQGASEYVIYDRLSPNSYLSTFDIIDGNGIDGTSKTDGIDVTNVALGSFFPQGVFIAQDGTDDVAKSNFKLVPWPDIAGGASPSLTIDTTWDPRSVGSQLEVQLAANFKGHYTIGPAPLTVNFTNLSKGVYDLCLWDFGDGKTYKKCDNPEHVYKDEGKFDVSLTVAGIDDFDLLQRLSYVWVGDFEYAYVPLVFAR